MWPLNPYTYLQPPKVRVALTNANRQLLWVVPWTSYSALVLSTLALLVTLEVESCYPTTRDNSLIHLIPAVLGHRLALWVVPLYCSGHWSRGLHTEHSLAPPDSHRYAWRNAQQARAAILQDSSRDCRGRVGARDQLGQYYWSRCAPEMWQSLVHWTDRDSSHQPTTNGVSHDTLS